jgi:hypothetical protein
MLMVSVIAAVAAAPVVELPKSSAPACGVTIVKIELLPDIDQIVPTVASFGWSPEAKRQALTVSYIVGGVTKSPPADAGKLPEAARSEQSPAVLQPNCAEPPKPRRRRRLSDYPMG